MTVVSLQQAVQADAAIRQNLRDAAASLVKLHLAVLTKRLPLPNAFGTWLLLRPDGMWGDQADFRGSEMPLGKVYVRRETHQRALVVSSIDLEPVVCRKGFLRALLSEIACNTARLSRSGMFDKIMIQNVSNPGVRDFISSTPGWTAAAAALDGR